MNKKFIKIINYLSVVGIIIFMFLLFTINEKKQNNSYEIETNLMQSINVDSLINICTLLNGEQLINRKALNKTYLIYLINSSDCKLCIEEIQNLSAFILRKKSKKPIQQLVAIISNNPKKSEWIGRGIGTNLPVICRIPLKYLRILEKYKTDKSYKQLIMVNEESKVVFRLKFQLGLKIDSALEKFLYKELKLT